MSAMTESQAYDIANKDIAVEDFEGELVVLDLKNGMYYSVGGAAAIVWKALVEGHAPSDIRDALPQGDARREALGELIGALLGHGLIAPRERSAPADSEAVAAALVAVEPDFKVEAFGDLADLLIADPIHDVDEDAGWPHRPDTGAV